MSSFFFRLYYIISNSNPNNPNLLYITWLQISNDDELIRFLFDCGLIRETENTAFLFFETTFFFRLSALLEIIIESRIFPPKVIQSKIEKHYF